jgi:tetratricopeptide (TPR) repeat protein
MLGEHEEALEAARRGCELHPDNERLCLRSPSVSLAALGRAEEAIAMFAVLDASSIGSAGAGAECLLGYGYVDAAQQLLNRRISWLENRPDEEKSLPIHRSRYGWTLLYLGQAAEARIVFDSLVEDDADNLGVRAVRGFFAAMEGDSAQARTDAEWLATLDRPYMLGFNTYWRAAISGALGERDDGLNLLRQAFSEGWYHSWEHAWYAELAPLRDHPEFQELMRPKG